MYKMILLDLDGTLLNDKKEISFVNESILKSIKNKCKIVFASARGFSTIRKYLHQLELLDSDNYTIAFNGSLILKNNEEKIIDNKIKGKSLDFMRNFIKENNYSCEWYYYTYNDRYKIDNNNIELFGKKESIYKIVCIATKENIDNIRNNITKEIITCYQVTSSEVTKIEFVQAGMTKLKAIEKLLEILKINASEVIAIGDGENDIDMLKYAGLGIAMSNAQDNVKKVADKITSKDNNNDGVANVLLEVMDNIG